MARCSALEIGGSAFDVVANEREEDAAEEDVLASAAMFSSAPKAHSYLINHLAESNSDFSVFSQDCATNGLRLQ